MGSCCSTEEFCSFRVKRCPIDVRVVQASSFKLLEEFPQDDQDDAADLESLISNSALREGLIEGFPSIPFDLCFFAEAPIHPCDYLYILSLSIAR